MLGFTQIVASFSRIATGWAGSDSRSLTKHFVVLHLLCNRGNHLLGTIGVELRRSSTPAMRRKRVYHEADCSNICQDPLPSLSNTICKPLWLPEPTTPKVRKLYTRVWEQQQDPDSRQFMPSSQRGTSLPTLTS